LVQLKPNKHECHQGHGDGDDTVGAHRKEMPNDLVERPATATIPPWPAHTYMRAQGGHDASRSARTCC
jgi:hypothetical protein